MLGKGAGHPPFFSFGIQLSAKLDGNLQNRFKRWFTGTSEKRREKRIKEEIEELDEYWNEVIYSVCGGDVTQMTELKRFDIFDFFDYINNKTKDRKQ